MQKIIAVLIGLVIVGGIAWYIREPEVVEETDTTVVFDACAGFGHYAARKAMDLAMGLSKTAPDGLNFKVTGITGNRITAEVVP